MMVLQIGFMIMEEIMTQGEEQKEKKERTEYSGQEPRLDIISYCRKHSLLILSWLLAVNGRGIRCSGGRVMLVLARTDLLERAVA